MWRDSFPLQDDIGHPWIFPVFRFNFIVIFESSVTIRARLIFSMQHTDGYVSIDWKCSNTSVRFYPDNVQVMCIARSGINNFAMSVASYWQSEIGFTVERPNQIFGAMFGYLNLHYSFLADCTHISASDSRAATCSCTWSKRLNGIPIRIQIFFGGGIVSIVSIRLSLVGSANSSASSSGFQNSVRSSSESLRDSTSQVRSTSFVLLSAIASLFARLSFAFKSVRFTATSSSPCVSTTITFLYPCDFAASRVLFPPSAT